MKSLLTVENFGGTDGGWPRSRRPKNRAEGAPGPSHLGTGETPDLNRQEQPHGPAASVPKAPLPTTSEQIFPPPFCR